MIPAHYKIAGQLQHHQELALAAPDPTAGRITQAQLALNNILNQADITLLTDQLADSPSSAQAQILAAWYDWREDVQAITDQHSGYAPSGLWLSCKLAQLERDRDLAVKKINRKHYLAAVKLYTLARIPSKPDDACARALFPKWSK